MTATQSTFDVGQTVKVKSAVDVWPEYRGKRLTVAAVRLMETRFIPHYYRIKAHVVGQPDQWVEGAADFFRHAKGPS